MPAGSPIIAVTGATGFLGERTLHFLLDAGNHVRALIRTPSKKPDWSHENLAWHLGALGDDDAGFVTGADCVLHIAGLIKARRRADYFAVNADGARALASAAQDAGVKRFVLLSSMAARVPELSDYSASKRAGEESVSGNFTGALAIIRAPAIFGPGDEATAPFYTAMKRGVLPIPGGKGWKSRRLSMAYVDDIASDLAQRAVTGAYDGQTVSPSTLTDISWPEFAQLCQRAASKPIKLLPIPMPLLYSAAGVTSVTSRLFGAGHLTLGKLREFLYQDWSSEHAIEGGLSPEDAMTTTMKYYKVIE